MIKIEQIIEELEKIRHQPMLHIQPVTPEALFSHLQSLARGAMLSSDSLTFHDFISARQAANRVRGWENRATSPYVEMREKKIPDEQIIGNLLDVEIQMWRILEQWQIENQLALGDTALDHPAKD